jgi:acetolactate synthase regulatory subunit
MTLEMFLAVSEFVRFARWRRTMAHWIAKQISATVATDRPTRTLESQVSKKTIL